MRHCFADPSDRFHALSGTWTKSSASLAYSNLSCPLEWSKYSCAHQGAVAHSRTAASLRFEPTGCRLLHLAGERSVARAFPSGRRVWFVGDSLLRQVLIAMGCTLPLARTEADWPPCSRRGRWPCHETLNCIDCGPHSGFNRVSLHLVGGASLHYTTRGASATSELPSEVRAGDVVVIQPGVHGSSRRSLAVAERALRRNASAIWLVTPQDVFKSPGGDGSYNVSYLRKIARTQRSSDLSCAAWTPPTRSRAEWAALRRAPELLRRLSGVVDLEGLNGLGDAKVGGGVGSFGDCQHFCVRCDTPTHILPHPPWVGFSTSRGSARRCPALRT
jgi:hypothetical protein